MDLPSLGRVVQELFSAGLAPSSQQNYLTGTRCYVSFCTRAHLNPFPVTKQILTYFVGWMYTSNLASSTVKNYLAAVRHSQIALGMGDPHMGGMPQLEYVLKGAKRKTSSSSRTRLPMDYP